MESTLYISELLSQHDCVIIPGLGGFIGSYSPASLNFHYHTFQPPSKKLLFNINLRQNDGLLADHIARKENVSFAEANDKVKRYAEDCVSRLKIKKQVVIRDVGRIYMGAEGTVQFDQDPRHNLLGESFGLQPFFSMPVRKEVVPESAFVPGEISLPRHMAKRALYRPLKWAAMLAIPVGLAILLSLSGYDRIRNSSLTYADILSSISVRLSPFSSEEKKAEPVPLEHAAAKTQTEETTVTEVQPAAAIVTEKSYAAENENPFAVIIGAFRVEENATKLISRLRGEGIPASLFDVTPGGLHRVASGTFTDRSEAVAALRTIRSRGFEGAWLLVK